MRRSLLAGLAASLLLATSVSAAEIVVDGGFDDPAHDAWDFEKYDVTSVIERSTVDASGASGSGSLYLDKAVGETPNSLRASQCIRVVPGAEYQVSGRVFLPSASLDANGSPVLAITWNTAEECNGSAPDTFSPSLFGTARDAWVEIGPFLAVVPPDAVAGRLYAGVVAQTAEGSLARFVARWDDVSVVPEPGVAAPFAAITALAALVRRS